MPRFNYNAYDVHGTDQAGAIDAPTAERAVQELKARGIFPTSLKPMGVIDATGRTKRDGGAPTRAGQARWRDRMSRPAVSRRTVAVFTRQLATLLRAGMPVVGGLSVLARQERNAAFGAVLRSLVEVIRAGGALSDALAAQPRIFGRLEIGMVRAGELGGALAPALERLAEYQEKSLQLRGRILAALVYPLVVLAVAALILAGLLVLVVPRFQGIFADLLKGAPLPALTQLVLDLSGLVQTHFVAGLGVVLGFGVMLVMVRRSRRGARWFDTLAIRLPLLGGLCLKVVLARASRTLGTLLASGVPILPALLSTRDTCGNVRLAEAFQHVHDRVKAGASLAGALEEAGMFPAMVTGLVEVGEQTGRLPEMLDRLADIYDGEIDTAVAGLNALIEPALIVFLALVVGTIVIALFLPIVRIIQLLG